ncbi:MAG: N-acetylglucosamine-6-phosphate deacetylase [Saprospiraceae bacterium]
MRLPGFIDLQINGYLGVDFSAPGLTEAAIARAFEAIVASGTAGFLPTVITSSQEVYEKNLPMLATVMGKPGIGRHALGIHLEGPFLCPEPGYIGAHYPALVRLPDPDLLRQLQMLAQGKIRAITLSAGLPGDAALISAACEMGIRVFLGHQRCDVADLDRAARAGAVALTHLGNGLPNELNRFGNSLWAGLVTDSLAAMIIADGHHVCDDLLRIILKMKGRKNFLLVSDASPVAGLPPGQYFALGNTVVLEPSGYLYAVGKNCLAGSSANMLHCANYMAGLGLLPPDEIAEAAFSHPLRLLGLRPEDVPKSDYEIEFDQENQQFGCKPLAHST